MRAILILQILFFSSLLYAEDHITSHEINSNNNLIVEKKETFKKFSYLEISNLEQPLQTFIKTRFQTFLNNPFSEFELNYLLKEIANNFQPQKLLAHENKDHSVSLQIGLSQKIEKISFTNLNEIDEDEALEILNLNLTELQIENKRNIALDKLQTHLKNIGFRKAIVTGTVQYNEANSKLKNEFKINIASGKKTSISNIKILGLSEIDNKKIEYKFNWYGKGDILTSEKLNEINKHLREFLNEEGYYLTTIPFQQISYSADETKAQVIYKLKNQQKYQIEILNNKFYSKDTLESEVLKLNEFVATDLNFGAELSEKLKLFYLKNGFGQADVIYYESKKNDKITITLSLHEGVRTKINKIRFLGPLSKKESFYLEKFLDLSSQEIQDGYYIQSDLDSSEKNLLTYLKNEGFLNCKISRPTVQPLIGESHNFNIFYNIEEGPQTKISEINISGNHFFSNQKILETLKVSINSPLNLNKFEMAINDLKVLYANNGFIESKITSEDKNLITYSENLTEAYINIEISEGPQVTVGSILIEGNNITHSKLILAELDFKVGELLTPAKLEETTARLQRTGHFSSTEIYSLEANTNSSQRTIIVRVVERNPGVFTSGLGLTNENNYTFQGYLGVAYRNLGGWGRGASARYEGNYNPVYIKFIESTLTFGYIEPYLFDTRMRFRVNYTSSRKVSDLSIRKVTLTNQAVWTVEQDLTSHITGIYEILNISNYVDEGINKSDEVKYNYSRDDLVIATTGPSIDIDFRDNIFNPTSGHFSKFSFEFSPQFLGNHNVDSFYRATGQINYYVPLHPIRPFVWANTYRTGYVKNFEPTDDGIPFDKKGFILGGRSTVRGFESSEFFPSTKLVGASYKFTDSAQYYLIKSELRIPLTKSNDFSLGLFYDGGEVQVDHIEFADRYRDAMGIGFRYNTPVGPFNLEYARKLDKKSYESDGAFHLSVGVF